MKKEKYILRKNRKLPFIIDEKKSEFLRVGPDTITVTLYIAHDIFGSKIEFDMNIYCFHKWFKKKKGKKK